MRPRFTWRHILGLFLVPFLLPSPPACSFWTPSPPSLLRPTLSYFHLLSYVLLVLHAAKFGTPNFVVTLPDRISHHQFEALTKGGIPKRIPGVLLDRVNWISLI